MFLRTGLNIFSYFLVHYSATVHVEERRAVHASGIQYRDAVQYQHSARVCGCAERQSHRKRVQPRALFFKRRIHSADVVLPRGNRCDKETVLLHAGRFRKLGRFFTRRKESIQTAVQSNVVRGASPGVRIRPTSTPAPIPTRIKKFGPVHQLHAHASRTRNKARRIHFQVQRVCKVPSV